MKKSIKVNVVKFAILSLVNVGQKITILQLRKISMCLVKLNYPVGSNLNDKARMH
jgi:hypothetical protein